VGAAQIEGEDRAVEAQRLVDVCYLQAMWFSPTNRGFMFCIVISILLSRQYRDGERLFTRLFESLDNGRPYDGSATFSRGRDRFGLVGS